MQTITGDRKLFGTDGVRGVAGEFLTADLARSIGRAAVAEAGADRPQVLILRDPRESGEMLEAALAAGITGAGGDAILAGILPTPAASILTRRLGLDLAAVISASHNPYKDNGIKLFTRDGTKLDDRAEVRIEARIGEGEGEGRAQGQATRPGQTRELEGALRDYLRELEGHFPLDLSGLRVALDCANGATWRAAPAIFERLGATVEAIAVAPDGRNINEGCGSTHIDGLVEHVVGTGADIGFAFDGDGDRVMAVDRAGRIHDGDRLIALIALGMHRAGALGGAGVAVTVMTNYAFHQVMNEAGIEVQATAVGDRHVLEALRTRGWSLGGEQSGHIIQMDYAPSGDGIAAALGVLRVLGDTDLAEVEPFRKLPQRLINVEVADRAAIAGADALWAAVERESEALQGRGRVLVRPSGTEPVVRVMAEAPSIEECEAVCARLVAVVEAELG